MTTNMSAKFYSIIVLCVLTDVFKQIPIDCKPINSFNDCFRQCLRPGLKGLPKFRPCVANCRQSYGKDLGLENKPSTTTDNSPAESSGKPDDQGNDNSRNTTVYNPDDKTDPTSENNSGDEPDNDERNDHVDETTTVYNSVETESNPDNSDKEPNYKAIDEIPDQESDTTTENKKVDSSENDDDQGTTEIDSEQSTTDDSNGVKFFGYDLRNSGESPSMKEDKKQKKDNSKIKPRSTPNKGNVLPNKGNSKSIFSSVSQPDHCGFKSTKDMQPKKLKGGNGLGRIVGGSDASPNEFPWVVSIQYFKKGQTRKDSVHFCGGAIITKNYIITAAHCMDRFVNKTNALVVKVGVNSPQEDSDQDLHVKKVIVHKGWNSSRQINDIALIKVRPDIKFTQIKGGKFKVNALCLPKGPTEPSVGPGILAGWGEVAFKSGQPSEWLQKVTVPIVNRSKCHEIYKKYLRIVAKGSKIEVLNTHICAGGEGGKDACRGDSGGALMQSKDRQSFNIGIVSFSVPCAIKNLPTIYTDVVHYMDWIYKNTK